MRLLRCKADDGFELLTFTTDNLPPYAVLSHTWLDGQEVTYHELMAGAAKDKAGYAKIRFCGERAARDGLQYFWVDTCCIDKSTSSELSTAINSMFRWYQCATKCYVYLSDVQVPDTVVDVEAFRVIYEEAFRKSRWFTRGWTLQELIAPATVEFFSKEGIRLGSKISLEEEICKITGIPIGAVRGYRLSDYSIKERMTWAIKRNTTVKEDKVYCLLGIFGTFMPLIYGEGENHAFLRLKEAIEQSRRRKESQIWEGLQDLSNIPRLREESFVTEDSETLASMNELGIALKKQGRYETAEAMHRQALATGVKVFGKEHPETMASINNLASALRSQGKYDAAEAMDRQTLATREKVLGEEHPDTMMSMDNLALTIRSQGKYEVAEAMHRQTLATREKVLGKEHPDTMTSMDNLALTLRSQCRYKAAEAMHRQTLATRENVLGKEHPDTMASMSNLANVLYSQGNYEAAEAMHKQALATREKMLGKEHPNILASMNNLASVLCSQGKYNAAEAVHRQALATREKVFGEEHPNTLASMNNLASVLYSQGKYDAAEAMHRQTLATREKVLGKEHPDTMASMNNLARVQEWQVHRPKLSRGLGNLGIRSSKFSTG